MTRHRWDYGGTPASLARRRVCLRCGTTGRTFGSGGWRTWDHTTADGRYSIGKVPPCEPAPDTTAERELGEGQRQ